MRATVAREALRRILAVVQVPSVGITHIDPIARTPTTEIFVFLSMFEFQTTEIGSRAKIQSEMTFKNKLA